MVEWAFLEPWRRVLRQLLQYKDEDELVVGSFHETLRCIRVHLFFVLDLKDETVDEMTFDKVFIKLREALELIGLALHYDKRVWPWLRPKFALPTFLYDANDLEVVWELTFHDLIYRHSGDSFHNVQYAIETLSQDDTAHLSDEYFAAKQELHQLIGDRFDPEYRIPISLVLAPTELADVDA